MKEWKTGVFKDRYLRSLVTFSERTELFDADGIRRLLARSSDRLYFSLVNFMIWYSLFVENVLADELGDLKASVRIG